MEKDMKKTKYELNIVKDDANKKEEIINNYKQEVQYLKNELNKNSTSRKRTDQAKSIKDQRKKTP